MECVVITLCDITRKSDLHWSVRVRKRGFNAGTTPQHASFLTDSTTRWGWQTGVKQFTRAVYVRLMYCPSHWLVVFLCSWKLISVLVNGQLWGGIRGLLSSGLWRSVFWCGRPDLLRYLLPPYSGRLYGRKGNFFLHIQRGVNFSQKLAAFIFKEKVP
jgi:hypothetical protein